MKAIHSRLIIYCSLYTTFLLIHVYLRRVDVHIQNELKFWQAMVEENYSFKSRLKEIHFLEDY